jgi:anaerobic dimethyl sulfoxide reductase subunit A
MSERRTSETGAEIRNSGCSHDCGGRCVLRPHVKDGRIARIESDTDDGQQFRACLRGRSYRQRLYHQDRLLYPLRRIGPRGEGRFERISWDEALDAVAKELKRVKATYGNEAIFYIGYSGGHGQLHTMRAVLRLLNKFGGCSKTWGGASHEGGIFASMASYGTISTGNTRDDLPNAKLIIMWGWNPAETIWDTNTSVRLVEAREGGTHIVSVDPRFTPSAATFAHEWIPIKPCTDTAALIAMSYVIIDESLHDRTFLERYTLGFDSFKAYVTGAEDGIPKTPRWAEGICGIPAETLARLARDYATTKPAALIAGWGPGRTAYGEQYHRAAIVLAAMTGNIGVHGGNAAGFERSYGSRNMSGFSAGKNPLEVGGPVRKDALRLPGGTATTALRVHVSKVWDAMLSGRKGGYPADYKLLYVTNANPLNQFPRTNKGVEALQSLEFVIVHEQFMTATARYADILLPVTTILERNDIAQPWLSAPYYIFVNKVVEPLGESKSDFDICRELAARLGVANYSDLDDEGWLRKSAESTGDIPNYQEFKKTAKHVVNLPEPYVSFKAQIEDPENHPFPTPSGKIEIFSGLLAEMENPRIPPVPKYLEPPEGPSDPLRAKYPLQLITTHFRRRVHSIVDNVPWLRELEPDALWINPEDAEPRGIRDGDTLRVFNERGAVAVPAKVTERIVPGAVSLYEGAWYKPDESGIDRGGCPNVLTVDEHSPGGAFMSNTCLVEVEKAVSGAPPSC